MAASEKHTLECSSGEANQLSDYEALETESVQESGAISNLGKAAENYTWLRV